MAHRKLPFFKPLTSVFLSSSFLFLLLPFAFLSYLSSFHRFFFVLPPIFFLFLFPLLPLFISLFPVLSIMCHVLSIKHGNMGVGVWGHYVLHYFFFDLFDFIFLIYYFLLFFIIFYFFDFFIFLLTFFLFYFYFFKVLFSSKFKKQ